MAFAVHDLGQFELDRDAEDNPLGGEEDWDTLYDGGANSGGSSDAFTGVLPDIGADGGTQFHGGGSKDNHDITDWRWVDGEPLDKDDITNAYAAAYIYHGSDVCPEGVPDDDPACTEDGDLIIYFGLDRYANNGSAQVGFWFVQNPVGLTNNRSKGGYEFSGEHKIGDILVQSNFSQGGVIDTISVYEWVGSGGSEDELDLVYEAQDCVDSAPDGDLACATVNQDDTTAPWPFVPKFGTSGTFPQGSFFEGGINISALAPEAGCFSGFIGETRSSTPFDSRLKDFVLGSFSLCHIDGTKYLDVNGNGQRDDPTVEVGLENWEIQLTDGSNTWTTYTDSNGDYSFEDLANGSYTVSEVCPSATTPWVQTEPGVSNTDACGDETYHFDIDLTNTSGVAPFGNGAPAIDVKKACTSVVEVGGTIDYDFDVKNTGNVNLVNVDLTDSTVSWSDLNLSLAAQATLHYDVPFTAPSSATVINNTVNASGDFGSTTVYKMVSASDTCTTKVVDASIKVTPNDVNEVGDPHTFTVYVEADDGSGPSPVQGVKPTVSFDVTPGSVTDNCASTGTDASGECTVEINSSTVGVFNVDASITLNVLGVSLTRDTAGNSGPNGNSGAQKIYVDGTLIWHKVDEKGDPLGGAIFEICRTYDRFNEPAGECYTVIDNDTTSSTTQWPDSDPADGEFKAEHLPLGTWTIQETQAPSGFISDLTRIETVVLDFANPSGEVVEPWVNHRAGRLTHTNVSCQDYLTGSPDIDLTEVFYSLNQGKIHNDVSPGVFFYYTKFTAPSGSFTVTIDQTSSFTLFGVQNLDQVRLYNADCSAYSGDWDFTVYGDNGGLVDVDINDATAGDVFIISVKYDTKTLVGLSNPGSDKHYDFSTWIGGTMVDMDGDGLTLTKK